MIWYTQQTVRAVNQVILLLRHLLINIKGYWKSYQTQK
jgi:hypothetical protein